MSEQANNRRGAGWLGVGTLTSAEVNALSARHGRGPGAESNRARAGRGGPMGDDVLSAGRPGRDHDMEAKVHALALDVARAGICTYADARAHVEAMLAPRMGPLDAGQVREVFERVAGPCPTPDEADRLYGRGSDLALRIRAAWEVSPRGADGAILAPEMVTERTGPASKRPIPAPGQVWLPPVGAVPADWCASDGTVLIHTTPNLSGFIHVGVAPASEWHAIHVDAMRDPTNGWTCIGVATPHGRVMVGDGFAALGEDEAVIVAIGAGDSVLLRARDGWEQWTNASGLTDGGSTQRRTRYAPARAGERYRWRADAALYAVEVDAHGRLTARHDEAGAVPLASLCGITSDGRADPARWERLDPGQGTATDTQGRELAFDYGGSIKGPPSVDYPYTLPDLASAPRTLTLAPGSRLTSLGDGRTYRIEPEPERPTLTLAGPHANLRAIADAIGRALESAAPQRVDLPASSLTVTRDEMLFTPTIQRGPADRPPHADLAGDARALCALRACLQEAMATGRATLDQWGAKGPRVEVRRVGGPMVAPVAEQASEAARYQPDAGGGAGAWRWEAGE